MYHKYKLGDKVFIVDDPGYPPLFGIIRYISKTSESTYCGIKTVRKYIMYRFDYELVPIPTHASENQIKALERLLDER
jgi:hypothetical protein